MQAMLTRACFGLAILMATPVWSQLTATPFETPTTQVDQSQMLTPPPVSAETYPTMVGSQSRSNFLAAGLAINTAYNDNVLVGEGTNPISDFIYIIAPTIALNKTTPRQNLVLSYSPGFTFYQHTSTLDSTGQSAAASFQYRLSQHTTISIGDTFQKSSNVFDQLYPPSGGAISGSTQTQGVAVVAPYANQLRNTAYVGLSYQFSSSGMIGASGSFAENSYPNPAEASGFNNSSSLGGSVFLSRRLSSNQYFGVTYQYSGSQSNPVNNQTNPANVRTEVQTHTLLAFYTIYLNPTFSVSVSGGPEYTHASQPPLSPTSSTTPSVTASIGWQRSRTNFVASYSRIVSGDSGLLGAYNLNNARASVSWQIRRTWIVGSAAGYSNSSNATPSFSLSNPGGETISGTMSVQHSISERLGVEFGYAHLHQSYSDIRVISTIPDSNREYISISYRLTRPLGR
jgi:hypothetical protein